MPITPQTLTLHRYFIWADRMKVHFDWVLKNKKLPKDRFDIDSHLYMSMWYGMTYVLIEGWCELNLHDERVDYLLESPNVDLLRKYRNGVFHFQKDYYDEKHFIPLIQDGQDVVRWIRELREAFSDYFIRKEG